MKIGDKVRFLSEMGGGRVAGFQGKNVVLVEDEDGFEVPMAINEVVVIGEENYDTSHVIEAKATSVKAALSAAEEEKERNPAGSTRGRQNIYRKTAGICCNGAEGCGSYCLRPVSSKLFL